MNVNRVFLAGNLTRDPELLHMSNGTALCKFGVAVNEKYTSGGEKKEKTVFVDVTAWARTAEVIAEHLKCGDPIFIEGRLDFSEWTDESNGKSLRRTKLAVVCERFQFVGSKRESGAPKTNDGVPF